MFDRSEACLKFCDGLDDGVLKLANDNGFTAKLLWQQRDAAFEHLAMEGLLIYDNSGHVARRTH